MSKSSLSQRPILLVTCEHGGNDVPPEYHSIFDDAQEILHSHRGWDPGALELAEEIADVLNASLFMSTTTRLLIELNRSLDHAQLFSEFTRDLPNAAQALLIETYYRPYRAGVERYIASEVGNGKPVLHLSVHSFTPVLNGEVRSADIGLLYDPSRAWESGFCAAWRDALQKLATELRVRMNYPYWGTDDGFTTYLRTKFADAQYAGIELEVNQAFPLGNVRNWQTLPGRIIASLDKVLTPEQ